MSLKALPPKQKGISYTIKKVDKTKMLQFISNLIKKWSPDKLSSITDDELRQRIEKIPLIEGTVGILNELSSSQNAVFRGGGKGVQPLEPALRLQCHRFNRRILY